MTLYRKYRPQTFSEVVGQDHVVKTLQGALESGRLSHAYLFCGPRGVGKTTMARIMAKAVNCLAQKNRPCGKCANCLAIAQGSFIDLIEIDAASNRGIDEMRDLRDKIRFAPNVGKMKVYIIDEVHMLTREAHNALLKTLEEPPEHVLFIFATTEPHKLPQTVISRCQRFDFHFGKLDQLKSSLSGIAKSEGFDLPDDIADIILKASGGSFRDAHSLLDQLSSSLIGGKLKAPEALQILQMASVEQTADFLAILESRDVKKAMDYLETLRTRGVNFEEFLNDLIKQTRTELIDSVQDGSETQIHNLVLKRLIRAVGDAKLSPIDSLALELAAIDVCLGAPETRVPQVNQVKTDSKGNIMEALPAADGPKIEVKEIEKNTKKLAKPFSADQKTAVVEEIGTKNKALSVLLGSASWTVRDGTLKIAVEYPIYKDTIMSKRNLGLLEQTIENSSDKKVRVICEVIRAHEDLEEDLEAVFGV
jgi:DNA polymerase III subunit gamma/tau